MEKVQSVYPASPAALDKVYPVDCFRKGSPVLEEKKII